jgi:hypothetical protein
VASVQRTPSHQRATGAPCGSAYQPGGVGFDTDAPSTTWSDAAAPRSPIEAASARARKRSGAHRDRTKGTDAAIRPGRDAPRSAEESYTGTARVATKPASTLPVTVASWWTAPSSPKTLSDVSDV